MEKKKSVAILKRRGATVPPQKMYIVNTKLAKEEEEKHLQLRPVLLLLLLLFLLLLLLLLGLLSKLLHRIPRHVPHRPHLHPILSRIRATRLPYRISRRNALTNNCSAIQPKRITPRHFLL